MKLIGAETGAESCISFKKKARLLLDFSLDLLLELEKISSDLFLTNKMVKIQPLIIFE